MKVYGGRSTIKDECATGMDRGKRGGGGYAPESSVPKLYTPHQKPLLTIHVLIKYNQQKNLFEKVYH